MPKRAEPEDLQAKSAAPPGQFKNNRYAQKASDFDDECQSENKNDEEVGDAESSRGSAWPSETSRLTPH